MENKQSQKAGDGAMQVQCHSIVIQGIDEKRAREIYDEKYAIARKEFTEEASKIAADRVKEFGDRLLEKMKTTEKRMEAFADPSFQLLLVEAQRTAAATERLADYDLLTELLAHRAENINDRQVRLGINRAVEIIDDIPDDALLGLTLSHCLVSFGVNEGDIQKGLDRLESIYGRLITGRLPQGSNWQDQLDILDTIRLNLGHTPLKMDRLLAIGYEGYVDLGIKKDSEQYRTVIKIMNSVGLNKEWILEEHIFNNDYVRLKLPRKDTIEILQCFTGLNRPENIKSVAMKLLQAQKEAFYAIYNLYEQNEDLKAQNLQKFILEWDRRPNLKKLREWWDQIPLRFSITAVGRVIAQANAQRYNKEIPDFE